MIKNIEPLKITQKVKSFLTSNQKNQINQNQNQINQKSLNFDTKNLTTTGVQQKILLQNLDKYQYISDQRKEEYQNKIKNSDSDEILNSIREELNRLNDRNEFIVKSFSSLKKSIKDSSLNIKDKLQYNSKINELIKDIKENNKFDPVETIKFIQALQSKNVEVNPKILEASKQFKDIQINREVGQNFEKSVENLQSKLLQDYKDKADLITPIFKDFDKSKISFQELVKELKENLKKSQKYDEEKFNKLVNEVKKTTKFSNIAKDYIENYSKKFEDILNQSEKSTFQALKESYLNNKISRKEFIDEVKKIVSKKEKPKENLSSIKDLDITLERIEKNTNPKNKDLANADEIKKFKLNQLKKEDNEDLDKIVSELKNIKDDKTVKKSLIPTSGGIDDMAEGLTENLLGSIFKKLFGVKIKSKEGGLLGKLFGSIFSKTAGIGGIFSKIFGKIGLKTAEKGAEEIAEKDAGKIAEGGLETVAKGGLGSIAKGGLGIITKGAGRIALPIAEGIQAISTYEDYKHAKNTDQRKEDVGKGAGSGVGMAIGGALGSLLGPLGTIAGGYLGSKIGGWVGKHISKWFEKPQDQIPDQIKQQGPLAEVSYINKKLIPEIETDIKTGEGHYKPKDLKEIIEYKQKLLKKINETKVNETKNKKIKNINESKVNESKVNETKNKEIKNKKIKNINESKVNEAKVNESKVNETKNKEIKKINETKVNETPTSNTNLNPINPIIEKNQKSLNKNTNIPKSEILTEDQEKKLNYFINQGENNIIRLSAATGISPNKIKEYLGNQNKFNKTTNENIKLTKPEKNEQKNKNEENNTTIINNNNISNNENFNINDLSTILLAYY